MAWVRTDDNTPNHPKIYRAGLAAFGFFQAGLCYCTRNLTDGRDMSQFSDEDILRTITRGGGASDLSPIMPPWGHTLPAGEIRDLVDHVRKLCKCQFDPKARERFLREQGKQASQEPAPGSKKE